MMMSVLTICDVFGLQIYADPGDSAQTRVGQGAVLKAFAGKKAFSQVPYEKIVVYLRN
jgi:hypothetical protein